jgi:hypothetical protein
LLFHQYSPLYKKYPLNPPCPHPLYNNPTQPPLTLRGGEEGLIAPKQPSIIGERLKVQVVPVFVLVVTWPGRDPVNFEAV